MDGLPSYLLDDILFRIDPKSLAMTRCTNRYLRSHRYDQYFESEYFSRFGSGLLHITNASNNWLCYHPYGDSKSRTPRVEHALMESQSLGSCYGLLRLSIDGALCVLNPLTKKFRFLDNPRVSNRRRWEPRMYLGLAVDQIDRTTKKSLKIVRIEEVTRHNRTVYRFEIYSPRDSWRYSKTSITCRSSDLDNRVMKAPVYLNGSLHWLRKNGSILSFNPKTERARLIPIKLPQNLSFKTLFAAGYNSLTLISATEEVIHVYALENILSDPMWVLVRQIQDGVLDENRLACWNVEAYDEKRLVLSEQNNDGYIRMVRMYDLRANKWASMRWITKCCHGNRDFFQFTPSLSYVIGLGDILTRDDKLNSYLSSIIGVIDGISSHKVERKLGLRSVEEEEEKKLTCKYPTKKYRLKNDMI